MKLTAIFLFFIPLLSPAQTVCSAESRERLESILLELSGKDLSKKSLNDLNIVIGLRFLETAYVEKTLEIPGDEKLVINLTGLDCTTFLESVVTLTRLAAQNSFSIGSYEKELEFLRYREGTNKGYPSRFHYFSDWIYENEQKGILKDITKEIGGRVYENNPSFMSSNPKFYPQLANPDFVRQLQITEELISRRQYHFIPKDEIHLHETKIHSGDLIAITTSMTNLDIVHVGFAIERQGRIHLLHASSGSMKVEVSEKPLSDYLEGNQSQSGIMVCRLQNPTK
ncbi:DUF1460 domain-containing protein [Aquiflexum gelatinilyticum]|uniref:DUF1460 domain-containing protein n=1 Tax=Aquiflexum gelatinilyticum TaxID=2961943 RepID=A0A9X2P1V7_9BACT|nr:DUF1460 domain-containing protein [Aquiflexum gelatinilyticum]MCR9013703.1 DUF1460 domain-containing protein [Aquiflexum gelatinilyticum]